MSKLLELEWVRYVGILIIGMAIGAVFYPSKTITTEETSKFEQEIEKLKTEKQKMFSEMHASLHKEQLSSLKYKEESQKRFSSLKQENFKLKSRVKEKRFKIIRPDGTIEEKWFKESETDVVSSVVTSIKSEFTRKVSSIEKKWKSIHKTRVEKIKSEYEKKIIEATKTKSSTHKKSKTEINKRSFGVSLGVTNDDSYFSSVSYDIFGPVFLDLHLESDKQFGGQEAGIGIGLRF